MDVIHSVLDLVVGKDRNAFIGELHGTFFLTLLVGHAAATGDGATHLAIGAALGALIYWGPGGSGAHFNPAVTLGHFFHDLLSGGGVSGIMDSIHYIVAQVLGALIAVFFTNTILDHDHTVEEFVEHDVAGVILTQAIATALLVSVYFNAGDHLALAVTLTVVGLAAFPAHLGISGLNPAVAFHHAFNSQASYDTFVFGFIGQLLGAVYAALAHGHFFNCNRSESSDDGGDDGDAGDDGEA